MTERELHEAAKAKITDPSRHGTGALARDKNGDDVDPRSRDAVSWCAYGALLAVARGELLKRTQPIEPGDEVGLDAILNRGRRGRLPDAVRDHPCQGSGG